MVTFADMMSLLLALFVLMLSVASMNVEQYKLIAGNMRDAFGIEALRRLAGIIEIDGTIHRQQLAEARPVAIAVIPLAPPDTLAAEQETTPEALSVESSPDSAAPDRPDDAANTAGDTAARRAVLERLANALAEATHNPSVRVEEQDGRIVMSFPDSIAFPEGSDALKPSLLPVLNHIIPILRETRGQIDIIGHTDSTPITTERHRSNWDLSSARAVSVVHYLQHQGGIAPGRLVAIGRADTRPLILNDTPDHRATNRRVEISIHPQ